jgi:predicted DsbA family dithiol-disulfide isomerase
MPQENYQEHSISDFICDKCFARSQSLDIISKAVGAYEKAQTAK